MNKFIKRCFLPVISFLFVGSVYAQPTIQPVDPGQKSAQMVRTDTPPVIDGMLDDVVWQDAAFFDNLHQVEPIEYAEPSEKTEVYMLYDDDALYVGIRLYMSDLDDISANVMRQGANINTDDTIYVTLDPFNTQRGGYFFGVNANGARSDGLYRNVTEFYGDWNSIYYVEVGLFDGGWVAEFEIPFKSLSFDDSTETWGLNFSRSIKSRNEVIAWVTRNRSWNPSSSGLAVGFENLDQGLGLDIVPSASLNSEKQFNPGGMSNTDSNFEPSLDIAYKITPSLNGLLTFNTDFSATEVDDRQVNLTRFGLFFPEKRDFFLREADIFEFGRIGAQGGFGGGQNGRPFFSRKIGLNSQGEVVGLDAGAKVSGRIGNWEVGALTIRQEENLAVEAENLSVLRAKVGLGQESTLGVIFTDGNPNSNIENSLGGFDYLYRNSRLAGGRILEVSTWYQQSDTDGIDDDQRAAGVGFSVPSSEGFRGGAAINQFEDNFNPALGFVNRRGIKHSSGDLGYTLISGRGWWQSMFFSVDGERYEDIDTGALQSDAVGVTPLQLTTRTGDVMWFRSNFETEVLTMPFEISPGVVIPAGTYDFENHGVEFRTGAHRKLSANFTYIKGTFYDGDLDRVFGSVTWQPSPKIRTRFGYNVQKIELPFGDFTTRLLTANFDYIFSSRLSWANFVQYDNISETMGFNMRLHWIPEEGQDLFFVINHTLEDFDRDNHFRSAYTNATVKASYTFRF